MVVLIRWHSLVIYSITLRNFYLKQEILKINDMSIYLYGLGNGEYERK